MGDFRWELVIFVAEALSPPPAAEVIRCYQPFGFKRRCSEKERWKNPWLIRVFWGIIQLYGDYFVNRYKDPGRKQPGFNGIQRYQKSNWPEAEQTQWCRGHLDGRLEFWCHVWRCCLLEQYPKPLVICCFLANSTIHVIWGLWNISHEWRILMNQPVSLE